MFLQVTKTVIIFFKSYGYLTAAGFIYVKVYTENSSSEVWSLNSYHNYTNSI